MSRPAAMRKKSPYAAQAQGKTQRQTRRMVLRTTQIIFGERQHLKAVLGFIRRTGLASSANGRANGRAEEVSNLRRMIERRTDELNRINANWDRKIEKAWNLKTPARELQRLAVKIPRQDYLLARLLTEHPKAPGRLLSALAGHPYSAVRENVARHPNSPPDLLARLAKRRSEPLWMLVSCNPAAPLGLQQRLRARLRGTIV